MAETRSYFGPNAAVGVAAALGAAAIVAGVAMARRNGEPRAPDSAPARTRRGTPRFGKFDVVGRTVTINKPRSEVYAVFRDPPQMARIMENIRSVKRTGEKRAVWTIAAPAGTTVEVETEIVTDRPDEEIAWRSVEGSEIETQGKVVLRDAPGGRGTEVEAIVAYKAPFGELGRMVAALFGKEPAIQSRRDLKRLKMLMETGEIAISRNHRTAKEA